MKRGRTLMLVMVGALVVAIAVYFMTFGLGLTDRRIIYGTAAFLVVSLVMMPFMALDDWIFHRQIYNLIWGPLFHKLFDSTEQKK